MLRSIATIRHNGARENSSRAKEFDFIFGFPSHPKSLERLIKLSPNGAATLFEGIRYEWGNIDRLIPGISASNPIKPLEIEPKYVCHVDHLSASRKREIELGYGLARGSISSMGSKVDLLVVDVSGKPYYISLKDDSGPSKLGQVSRSASYNKAHLSGGLNLSLPKGKVPLNFTFKDTALTSEQFNKLNRKDQTFAYFKNCHTSDWNDLVEMKMRDAITQLKSFGTAIKQDRDSLLEFIAQTFAGEMKNSPDFYLILGDQPIKFASALTKLNSLAPIVDLQIYSTSAKTSLIIWIEIRKKRYCLTKIEPSFDGGNLAVSQTKGIIFYFQQYGADGENYKNLFIDISK